MKHAADVEVTMTLAVTVVLFVLLYRVMGAEAAAVVSLLIAARLVTAAST